MTLVAAMAMQNAAHRTHLVHAPPSTIMTGSTTQIMLDLAEIMHGLPSTTAAATRARFKRMSVSVAVFAAGCGLASFLYLEVGKWCFCALPVLGISTLMMGSQISAADG
jgi:uncharacterized membrane protein YoaK (UPF0700 family)